MRTRHSLLFCSLALAASATLFALAPTSAPPASPAPTQVQPGKFVAAEAIDVRSLLPDPPSAGSALSKGEVEVVLAAQQDASKSSLDRAISEDAMTVWLFADIFGPGFSAENKPKTAALLKQVERDSKAISDRAKVLWARPRPCEQDSRVVLHTQKPTNNSYPSGHATRAAVWAEVLSLLVPDKSDAVRARARLIGLDRVILGVHFPSDIAAGDALGKAIADAMKQDAAFQRDLNDAKDEWKP